jgi:hypothetical protein
LDPVVLRPISGVMTLLRGMGPSRARLSAWLLDYFGRNLGGYSSFRGGIPVDPGGEPIPWYTYGATEYLRQFDFSTSSVFEYGSGNSSRFWAGRALSVTSVESDPAWFARGSQDPAPNHTLLLETDRAAYINTIHRGDTWYDVIVVDGVYRYDCAVESLARVREGGMLILDNADWYPETARFLRDAGWFQIDFTGPGPVNLYAWSTSLFVRDGIRIPRIPGKIQVAGGTGGVAEDDRPL